MRAGLPGSAPRLGRELLPRVDDGGDGLAYLDDRVPTATIPEPPELELGRTLVVEFEKQTALAGGNCLAAKKLTSRLAAEPRLAHRGRPGGEVTFLAPPAPRRLAHRARPSPR